MRAQNMFDIAIFDSGLIETVIDHKPHSPVKKEKQPAKSDIAEAGFVFQTLTNLGMPTMHILTT